MGSDTSCKDNSHRTQPKIDHFCRGRSFLANPAIYFGSSLKPDKSCWRRDEDDAQYVVCFKANPILWINPVILLNII